MKKGWIALTAMQWIPRLIFLTIVVFVCLFLIRMNISSEVTSIDAEMALYAKRIVYSPNIIAYVDSDIARVYPGIVDYDKFLHVDLEKSLYLGEDNDYMAGNITLVKHKKSFIFNEVGYNKWMPLVKAGLFRGAGSFATYTEEMVVLVNKDGRLMRDILNITLVAPKG
jgi:hypothetical protein